MPATIVSVNSGRVREFTGAQIGRSAIDKRPVSGPVAVGALGLSGDEQGDRANHGGQDQAVYAFAVEDLDRWASALGRTLGPGIFGENLTTAGMDVAAAVIGETWSIGQVRLQVSSPRVPCATFQAFLDSPAWVKRFTADARPGAYLRVLVAGELAAGMAIAVTAVPSHGLTVGEVFAARTTQRELLPRLLEAPELPAEWHERARAYLSERDQRTTS